MHPIYFEGSVEIKKPETMTDEQCFSLWAKYGWGKMFAIIEANGNIPPALYTGIDTEGFSFYMTAWKPNKEDIEAINRGEPIYVKVLSKQLPPMSLFTLDENNQGNF